MKTIPLTQGQCAIVDDEDFDRLSGFKWFAHWDGYRYYALRKMTKSEFVSSGKSYWSHVKMHRQLLSAPTGVEVDHIDGNGLNNQQGSLRTCLHSENMKNTKLRIVNKSGYKGVCWKPSIKKWIAQIRAEKVLHLGVFKDKVDAARAYDRAALNYYGRFAMTNKKLGLLP